MIRLAILNGMYQAIIFDFFGVIRTDALKSWLTLHNYELNDAMLTAIQHVDRGDITSEQFFGILSNLTGHPAADIYKEMEQGAALDYHVLELIKQLKGRYKIGLLSNSSSMFLRDILENYSLNPYFDAVIISSEVGLIKPQPEIFMLALRKLNTPAEHTIFIDDNHHNVVGAQKVGIRGLDYTNLQTLRADLARLGV